VFLPAAAKMGETREGRAVGPLLEALGHTDAWFREAALRALGEIGDSRGIEAARRCLDDDDSLVRDSALVALEKLDPTRATERGEEPLEASAPPSDVAADPQALGAPSGRSEPAPPPEASPAEPPVREPSEPPPPPRLTTEPGDLPAAAGVSESKPAPESRSRNGPEDPTAAMVRSLSASLRSAPRARTPVDRDTKAFDALQQIVKTHIAEPPAVRRPKATAERLKDARAVPVVAVLLHDPDREVRRAAVNTLSRVAAPEVIPLLVEALKDTDLGVVATASQALVSFGQDAIRPLRTLVEDSRDRVRQVAIETLRRIDRHWDEKERRRPAPPAEPPQPAPVSAVEEIEAAVSPAVAVPVPTVAAELETPQAEAAPAIQAAVTGPEVIPEAEAPVALEEPPVEPGVAALEPGPGLVPDLGPPAEVALPSAEAPEAFEAGAVAPEPAPAGEPEVAPEAAAPSAEAGIPVPEPAPEAIAVPETIPPAPAPTPDEFQRVPALELVAALAHGDTIVRAAAETVLGALYPAWPVAATSRAAVAHLASALRSGDADVRRAAARALTAIDDPTACAALRETSLSDRPS